MKLPILSTLPFFGAIMLPTAVADETTTLLEMVAMVRANDAVEMGTRSLARDWIGDIEDEHGKLDRMRLEKGRIMDGEITLLRAYPNGSELVTDAPVYVESIPPNEKIRSYSTVEELQELLGTGQPGFSGWGGPKGMHSSHLWFCFSQTAENRLTYINVFAHTSFNEEQQTKGIRQINELSIRRGELWPADSNGQKERDMYLSGADKFAAMEAEKAQERQRYPQPLRDLILADEHPDDSDLEHLSAAVQAIRDNPDPKLFAQLIQEMHEGTTRMRSLLNHILQSENNLLDLKAWRAREEAIAVNACIDSLPLARDREILVMTLLRAFGGGKIEMEDAKGRGRSIQIAPVQGGYQMSLGGASDPLSLEQAQAELRRLYIKSRAEQAGGGQPATRPESK